MEEMSNKLQIFKIETKLNFNGTFSNNYDEMIYFRKSGILHFEEFPFSEYAQGKSNNMHEVLLSM